MLQNFGSAALFFLFGPAAGALALSAALYVSSAFSRFGDPGDPRLIFSTAVQFLYFAYLFAAIPAATTGALHRLMMKRRRGWIIRIFVAPFLTGVLVCAFYAIFVTAMTNGGQVDDIGGVPLFAAIGGIAAIPCAYLVWIMDRHAERTVDWSPDQTPPPGPRWWRRKTVWAPVFLLVFAGWMAWPNVEAALARDRCTFGAVSTTRYHELLDAARATARSETLLAPGISTSRQPIHIPLQRQYDALSAGMTTIQERLAAMHAVMRANGATLYALDEDAFDELHREVDIYTRMSTQPTDDDLNYFYRLPVPGYRLGLPVRARLVLYDVDRFDPARPFVRGEFEIERFEQFTGSRRMSPEYYDRALSPGSLGGMGCRDQGNARSRSASRPSRWPDDFRCVRTTHCRGSGGCTAGAS